MKKHITKRVVDGLPLPEGAARVAVWDDEIAGFGVVALSSGKRSFVLRYGSKRRRRQIVLGEHGTMTVAAARKKALSLAAAVNEGRDPLQEKEAKARATTWALWCDQYMAEVYEHKKNPRHDERYLALAVDRWGDKPLAELTKDDVQALVQHVAKNGTKMGAGAQQIARRWRMAADLPVAAETKRGLAGGHRRTSDATTTANRLLASIRACLAAAWRDGAVPGNVALRVKAYRENAPRTRWLDDDEMGKVLAAVDKLQNPWARCALRLRALTGTRVSEVLTAKIGDVDLERGVLTLRSTKAGNLQTVPLLPDVVAELRALPPWAPLSTVPKRYRDRAKNNPYLFPGDVEGKPLSGLDYHWKRIRKAAGLVDAWQYDLRRSFAQRAKTVSLQAASRLLRHSDVRVTARVYAAMGDEETRAAAEQVAKVITFKRTASA